MWKRSLVIAAFAPCCLVVPCMGSSVVAQAIDSQTRPSSAQPPPEQWQPDSVQRALVTGTTVPMDAPMPLIPTGEELPFAPPVAIETPVPSGATASGTPDGTAAQPGTIPGQPAIAPVIAPAPSTTTGTAIAPAPSPALPTATAANTTQAPTKLDTGVPLEPDIAAPENHLKPATPPPPPAPRTWFASLYGGRVTLASLLGALTFDSSEPLADSYLISLEAGKEITRLFGNSLSLDAMGQVMQHFGDQDHTEFTVALALRWNDFPWNNLLNTTIAVGEGLSFATEVPALEELRRENTSRLLNFLLFEITFALPNYPNWLLVGRINHRSGVFGLFNGVIEGSNNYAIGVRYKFR